MTNWQEFYQALPLTPNDSDNPNWACWLEHQVVYRASGEDAAKFLHSQLSNDVERLGPDEVRRAAYCSAKGRMLASLLYWRQDDAIYLQCHASLAEALIKRLTMFVLRAKVKFERVTDQIVLGLSGQAADQVLRSQFATLPEVNRLVQGDSATLLRLADSNATARYQYVVNSETARQLLTTLSQAALLHAPSRWELADIQAGIAEVCATTQDHFVPQMINFELIGGVNFKKGCYPGQEVVARSQYLGKLKRRMFIATSTVSAAQEFSAGAEVFNATEPEQACGEVVAIQRANASTSLALLQIRLLDSEAKQLHLGSIQGPALQLIELPYAIEDITA